MSCRAAPRKVAAFRALQARSQTAPPSRVAGLGSPPSTSIAQSTAERLIVPLPQGRLSGRVLQNSTSGTLSGQDARMLGTERGSHVLYQ